jgi:uncharacterized membrane protein
MRDLVEGTLAIGTLAVCIASWCFPWTRLQEGIRWIALQLPLLAFVLYAIYELLMPPQVNIRIDLLFLWPMLVITLGLYIIRMLRAHRRAA